MRKLPTLICGLLAGLAPPDGDSFYGNMGGDGGVPTDHPHAPQASEAVRGHAENLVATAVDWVVATSEKARREREGGGEFSIEGAKIDIDSR
jgi:hypothetical protein